MAIISCLVLQTSSKIEPVPGSMVPEFDSCFFQVFYNQEYKLSVIGLCHYIFLF